MPHSIHLKEILLDFEKDKAHAATKGYIIRLYHHSLLPEVKSRCPVVSYSIPTFDNFGNSWICSGPEYAGNIAIRR